MKLLGSANILAGPASFKVPTGQYARFLLRAAGTNQAGQTLTLANLGLITATWRNIAWTGVSFANVNALNGHVGGAVETATAAGGAFTHSCFLEASYARDGNVFDVTAEDNVYINVDLSGVTAAIVASGTIQLYGLPADGAMAYMPKLFRYTHSVAASGTQPETIAADNIALVFLQTLTNIARVQVSVDNVPQVQGEVAALLAASNYESTLETASTTTLLLNLNRSGLWDERLSDNVIVEVTATGGGAVATDVVFVAVDPTPDTLSRSRATLDSKVAVRQARKLQLNKDRAVKVSRAISGQTAA